MCGFYGHGYYDRNARAPIADYMAYNSHDEILKAGWEDQVMKHGVMANNSRLIGYGIKPATGKVVIQRARSDAGFTDDEKRDVSTSWDIQIPTAQAAAHWIDAHYGKRGDKDEFDMDLPLMLSTEGLGAMFASPVARHDLSVLGPSLMNVEFPTGEHAALPEPVLSWMDWRRLDEQGRKVTNAVAAIEDAAKRYTNIDPLRQYASPQQSLDFCFKILDQIKHHMDRSRERYLIAKPPLDRVLSTFVRYPNDYWRQKNDRFNPETESKCDAAGVRVRWKPV